MTNQFLVRFMVLLCLSLFMACNTDSDSGYAVKYNQDPNDPNKNYNIKDGVVQYKYTSRSSQKYYMKEHHTMDIEGADVNTFEGINNLYGKDASTVFYKGKKTEREVATFKAFDNYTTSDKNGVYYVNKLIPESDGPSFRILNSAYAIDTNYVYTREGGLDIVKEIDKSSFRLFSSVQSKEYALDSKGVYFNGLLVKGAAPTSFEEVEYGYFRDAQNIYYEGQLLSTNANQFEVFDFPYAKDQESVYYFGDLLVDSDPSTFKTLKRGYAKDAKNVYYYENKIEADAKSFRVRANKVSDKYRQYESGKLIKGVND